MPIENVVSSFSILLADPVSTDRQAIVPVLTQNGFCLIEADTARSALRLARHYRPSVIILEIYLPDMSGYELCARLRALPFVNHTPILFINAHHSAAHAAQALDCGGDDYLRKPFAPGELSARVRALLRRSSDHKQFATPPTLRLETANFSVVVNNRRIFLTPTEFSLLEHLCGHSTELHTANSLLETLWQYPPGDGDTALVRNHIRNLRRKIEEDPDRPRIIVSLHGRGYMINAQVIDQGIKQT